MSDPASSVVFVPCPYGGVHYCERRVPLFCPLERYATAALQDPDQVGGLADRYKLAINYRVEWWFRDFGYPQQHRPIMEKAAWMLIKEEREWGTNQW